jgi:hypothetical protein
VPPALPPAHATDSAINAPHTGFIAAMFAVYAITGAQRRQAAAEIGGAFRIDSPFQLLEPPAFPGWFILPKTCQVATGNSYALQNSV